MTWNGRWREEEAEQEEEDEAEESKKKAVVVGTVFPNSMFFFFFSLLDFEFSEFLGSRVGFKFGYEMEDIFEMII